MQEVDLLYGAMQGQLRLRQAIADFLTVQTGVRVRLNPESMCVLNGAGTVLDTVVQVGRPAPARRAHRLRSGHRNLTVPVSVPLEVGRAFRPSRRCAIRATAF